MSGQAMLKIRQVKSGIGAPVKHKRVLAALGLGKMNRTVERPDNEAVRGMVKKIPHLVRIVDDEAATGS